MNCLRWSTTSLALQHMPSFYMRSLSNQSVNHVPGLICQRCPRSVPESSPGRESWVRFEKRPSPAGTAENAPGCNPGLPPTLKWTISDSGQPTPGEIGLAWDDCYSVHVWSSSPRTDVLGHSQPSLRD